MIPGLEIPTGTPLVYELDKDTQREGGQSSGGWGVLPWRQEKKKNKKNTSGGHGREKIGELYKSFVQKLFFLDSLIACMKFNDATIHLCLTMQTVQKHKKLDDMFP